MRNIKNIKFGKKFLAGLLATTIIGTSLGAIKIHKDNEVKRVKNYLSDFLTSENYVDLSKISTSYDIKSFSGEALARALMDLDIKYVRITDSYIYNDPHVETFRQVTATNYDNPIGIDDSDSLVYEMYEPIRNTSSNGVTYEIPEGFTLDTIDVTAEPIRYQDLNGKTITVYENDYEDSYSLTLNRR